jgi:hypothetical protein
VVKSLKHKTNKKMEQISFINMIQKIQVLRCYRIAQSSVQLLHLIQQYLLKELIKFLMIRVYLKDKNNKNYGKLKINGSKN